MKPFRTIISLIILPVLLFACTEAEKPNFLWIVSEDNSPFLGCYGDENANTPNLDNLATEGFLYTQAYANAPVCAPARNTIISGVYACSNGSQHMRSSYPLSEKIRMYPKYLRNAGYYCTNNAKEDYNTIKQDGVWDESSNKAHYRNRQAEQPFFHIQNIGISHESSIHKSIPTEELIHRPEDMILPPYHPDTEDMRHDWAQYYDKITAMDDAAGVILDELEKDGLKENTIVFYYADHGGVLARSKRYIYESGTHVPFIIRIPDKFKKLFPDKNIGTQVDRQISFVDLAPTMLSLAGIPIPDYMQGNAFIGEQKTKNPEFSFMFRGRMDEWYDMSRAVKDNKYRYIKNYMPHRIYGQRVSYLWRAPSTRSWEEAYINGECDDVQSIFWNTKPAEELYDTENDPWEVNNLVNEPEYQKLIKKMRKANEEWMLEIADAGFIPEADLIRRRGEIPAYDYMRSGEVDLKKIIDAADLASLGDEKNIEVLIANLENDDSAIRYWGATGLLILGDKAISAKENLLMSLNDESPDVVCTSAELLYSLGEEELATKALLKVLEIQEDKARCHALNSIYYLDEDGPEMRKKLAELHPDKKYQYSWRIVNYLIEKWGINPKLPKAKL